MKTVQKSDIREYIVKPRVRRRKVNWRDYLIPTKNKKKKRRVSEMVDKIVYGI